MADDEGDDAVSAEHVISVPHRFRAYVVAVLFGSESEDDDPAAPPVDVVAPSVVNDTLGGLNSARLSTICSCWTLAETPG
ncbi:MAG: hypothetical protein WD186_03195, partial [Actinomycetota bacterium]